MDAAAIGNLILALIAFIAVLGGAFAWLIARDASVALKASEDLKQAIAEQHKINLQLWARVGEKKPD